MHTLRTLLLSGLLMALILSSTLADNSFKATLFDKPLHETHSPLPPDRYNPQAKSILSCFYYLHLMVKQVDFGEIGAAEISFTFVPKGQPEPPCRQKDTKDERVVDFNGGAFYFQGVKSDYVFFTAADGANGAMGFSVYNNSGMWIFADTAVDVHSIKLMTPVFDIDKRPWYENPVTLRYQKAYEAPCSLQADEKKCWELVKQATGLTDQTPPDCSVAYKDLEKSSPNQDTKELAADSSVIRYEVEVVLDGHGVIRVTPISKAEACYPAD
jgi:3D (Asp-Asp-Asp) domain-containing protein